VTVPVVALPNPWEAMLRLLQPHPELPAALAGKVVEELPDDFPAGMPYLHVVQVPGGRRDVPRRLATALFDLQVYSERLFDAMELARHVAAVVLSLEQKSTVDCGFTVVRLLDEPFPLPDPDTGANRAIIPISATYRPM
jgi:hypothetical protein